MKMNHIRVGIPLENRYESMSVFVSDLESMNLKSSFTISDELWDAIAVRINSDPSFAGLVKNNSVLMLLESGDNQKVADLCYLAESCVVENTYGGPNG